MIIQTNTSYILGFFTTKDWAGANQFWQYDKDAFVFSFVNHFSMPVKMNVLVPEFALRGNPSELNVGYELLINDQFNRNLNYGWSGPGNSYELPNFVNESAYLLIDSSGFFASEIEVYEVDGKKNILLDSYSLVTLNKKIFFYQIGCWQSPCLNNGKCHKSSNNKHGCTCTNGYFGGDCQSKVLDSIIFQNSTILTQSQSFSLQQLINFASSTKINLIYQASRDGFGLKDFHSKCDGVLNTNPNYAIYQGPDLLHNNDYNFIGFGQNDILLNDYSNTQISSTLQLNISSYQLPSSLQNNGSFSIAGETNFLTLEIEVYSVDRMFIILNKISAAFFFILNQQNLT